MESEYIGILRSLGETLRSRREEIGLSQEEVSFSAGIHRTYLSQIELGARNPSFIVLVRICEALNTSLVEVAGECFSKIKNNM